MIAPASLTLQAALAKYLDSRWMADSSAGLYRIACALYSEWAGEPVLVSEITAPQVMAWMRWLSKTRAPQTVNSKRRQLLTIVRSVGEAPRVPRMREVRRAPTAWTPHEVSRILAHVSAGQPKRFAPTKGRWSDAHWKALILVLYDTGCRVGAVLSLEVPECFGASEPHRDERRLLQAFRRLNARDAAAVVSMAESLD